MRLPVLITAVLCAAFAACAAHAQDAGRLEKALESDCIATRADQDRVLAQTQGKGWSEAGPEADVFIKKAAGSTLLGTPVGRKYSDGHEVMILVVGHGYIAGPKGVKIGALFCGVSQSDITTDDARAVVANVLGFPPVRTNGDTDLYVFTETGGQRTPFGPKQAAEALKAAEAGNASFITAGSAGDVFLLYAVTTGVIP